MSWPAAGPALNQMKSGPFLMFQMYELNLGQTSPCFCGWFLVRPLGEVRFGLGY